MGHRPGQHAARDAAWPDAAARLAALVDSIDVAIIGGTLDGTITDWNRAAEHMFGMAGHEVIGTSSERLLGLPPDHPLHAALARVRAGGDAERVDTTHVDASGRVLHHALTIAPVRDERGGVVGVSTIARDVTDFIVAVEREHEALRVLEGHQRILERIARGDDVTSILDDLCRHIEARFPGSHCSILSVDPVESVLHHTAAPTLPVEFQQAIDGLPVAVGMGACGSAAATGEAVIISDTTVDPLAAAFRELADRHALRSCWSHPLLDGAGVILGTFALYRDDPHRPDEEERTLVEAVGHLAALAIERRRDEEALRLASLVDPLTGLPNRTQFLQWLDSGLHDRPTSLAVLFLDLDRFKAVNDSMGHPAGDQMLVEAARRLSSVLRSDDVLSRFGGDEFTILVRDADVRGLAALTERVLETFSEPFLVESREFFMSVSIGVARGTPTAGPFDLIRDADVAMYEAKAQGPGRCVVFGQQLRHRAVERVTLEAELRRGLDRGELIVHYQPIFDLATEVCVGAEALVRWQHPERGLVAPDSFIPIAEETGLIVALGNHVLDQVLAQIKRWEAAGIRLPVSVNVSPLQLSDSHLADEVRSAVARHGVDPTLLYLEITETAVMQQIDTARSSLESLYGGGIGIFIDDFGTGYSSIGRLSDLPVSGLKIDRRFTAALSDDSPMAKVTVAIIDLANALDLQVVAEGIETEAALEALVALECEYGQGFHLGRPAGPEALEALVQPPAEAMP